MMSFWGTTGHNVTWKGTNWTEVMTFPEWPFLGEKVQDETFYNWNRFYFIYCDGSGAQGYREEPITVALPYYPYEKKVYFRGYNNTIANMDQVMRIMPPEATDTFVVNGCSDAFC